MRDRKVGVLQVAEVVARVASTWWAETPNPAPSPPRQNIDPSVLSPGLVGFLLFAGLAVAIVVLVFSMNRQLKKIDFDEEAPPQDSSGNASKPADPNRPNNEDVSDS